MMDDLTQPSRAIVLAEALIRRAPKGAPVRSEHEEQVAVIAWAHRHEHEYGGALRWLFAIPNGGARDVRVAQKLKAEGVQRGVPDIFLPVARHGYYGLFVELKRVSGSRVEPEQKEWLAGLQENGYSVALCYGAEAAKEAIKQYLE